MPNEDKPIEPGSITQTADSQGERIAEVSSVANTVNQMQQEVNQKITETEQMAGETEKIAEVQNATIGVLHKMKETMGSFASGINTITSNTAQATKDAIGQYGKAISQDISYNKQSVVAMALARSTPIFGYFAAKFMETDVFRKAKAKMAESLKNVFSGIGKTIGGFFSGKKKTEKEEIPKLQRGGYVKKGGMVEVHAGEIVAPIEKVLSRVDESISAVEEIGTTLKRAQLRSMANLAGYVRGQEQLGKVGIFRGFLKAMGQVQRQYEEPAQMRMLRAVLSIQDTLGATIGTWEQVWTKMLVEHPTFRNIVFGIRSFSKAITLPGRIAYQVFKARGGYQAHLPNAKNPFENMSIILGMLYAEGMWRLDNIAKYTRLTVEATRDVSSFLTGKTYPPVEGVPRSVWRIATATWTALKFVTGAKWIAPWIEKWVSKRFPVLGFPFYARWEGIPELIEKIHYRLSAQKQEFEAIYGDPTRFISQKKEAERKLPKAIAPVKVIEYSDDVMDAQWEYIKEIQEPIRETTSSLLRLEDKKWREEKKGFKTQKAIAKDIDQMNKRGKMRRFLDLIMGGIGKVGGFIGSIASKLFSPLLGLLGLKKGGLVGQLFKWVGLRKGSLGFLGKSTSFAKFLGPAAGYLAAAAVTAGLSVAIYRWLDKYITPWLRRKWNEMDEKSRAAEKTLREKAEAASEKARATTGIEGMKERYKTKLNIGMRSAKVGRDIATDPRLGQIHKGQWQYMEQNIDKYLRYPVEMLTLWRNEWLEDESLLGGVGPRAHFFGWGENPEEYGKKREMRFLLWLEKNKKARTKEQIEAEASVWTSLVEREQARVRLAAKKKATVTEKGLRARVQDLMDAGKTEAEALAAVGLKKGTEAYEKLSGILKEKKEIAADYVADVEAGSRKTITALGKQAKEQAAAMKEMGQTFSETVGAQATTIVNSVSDNSQRIANTAGGGGINRATLYQDMKKTVITGKVDWDTLELFWE